MTTTLAWWSSRSEADGGGVLGQEPAPGFEGPVAGDAQGAAFVGGRHDPEQQLGAGVVERGEPDFVDEDQVVAEQGIDDPGTAHAMMEDYRAGLGIDREHGL